MAEFKTVDDFLNYRGSEGGGGGARRTKSWKKDPGHINLWLHTKQVPCSVWIHPFVEVVVRTNKDDPRDVKKNVWSREHVCWEDESVLKKQRFRGPDGKREHPPKTCAWCLLIEAVRDLVEDGKLEDTDVLFRFEGADDPSENRAFHAGGLTAMWPRDMNPEEKQRLSKSGIYASKAWQESAVAKLNYALAGVNNDNVEAGVTVSLENQLIGDKVKKVIRDEIQSREEMGNPFINPYCLRILARPEEKKFDEKYHVLRIDKYKLTPDVEKLIRGEKPDLSKFTTRFNPTDLRAVLEKHATEKARRVIPWDAIFAPSLRAAASRPEPEQPSQAEIDRAVASNKSDLAPTAAAPAGDPCEVCNAAMAKGQLKCGNCGEEYQDDGADEAKPAPNKEAIAQAYAAAQQEDFSAVDDDQIPF